MAARAIAHRPAQSIVFYGLRGVGKTVLLNELLGSARQAGWICAMVEADTGSERTRKTRREAGFCLTCGEQLSLTGVCGNCD